MAGPPTEELFGFELDRANTKLRQTRQHVAGINREYNRASKELSSMTRQLQDFAGLSVKAFVVAGVAAFTKQIIDSTVAIQRMNQLLEASGAGGSFDRVLQIAQDTRQEITAIGELYARINRSVSNLGATQEQVARATQAVAAGLALGGASTQEAQAAALQLGQALASGRLQGDELRSILEAAPVLAQELAKQLGVSVGELRQLGSEGVLTSDVVFGALIRSSEELNNRLAELEPTVAQSFTVLTNQLVLAGAAFGEFLADVLELNQGFESLANFIGDVSDTRAFESIRDELDLIANAVRQSRGDFEAFEILDFAGREALGALRELRPAILSLPLEQQSAAVATAIQHLERYQTELEENGQQHKRLYGVVVAYATAMRELAEEIALASEVTNEFEAPDLSPFTVFFEKTINGARETAREMGFARDILAQINDGTLDANLSTEERTQLIERLNRILGINNREAEAAARAFERWQKEVETLVDRLLPVEAALRIYREEQELLAEAFEKGEIDLQTYNRALEQLNDDFKANDGVYEYIDAIRTLKEETEDMAQGLSKHLREGGSAWEHFGNKLVNAFDRIADAYYQQAIDNIVSNISTGNNNNGGGNFLSNIFKGFFAEGGNIPKGGYGIVGENGPEIITGPATVTPMGSGVTVGTLNNNFSVNMNDFDSLFVASARKNADYLMALNNEVMKRKA